MSGWARFVATLIVVVLIGCGQATAPNDAPEAPLGAPGADTRPRLALVIGIGAYQGEITRLQNPVRDAELMARTLRSAGFQMPVPVVKDAGRAELEEALTTFSRALRNAGDDAIGVIYFAGHGMQINGDNYLLPRDARLPPDLPPEPSQLRRELSAAFFPADDLIIFMGERPNGANILILDACRDNPLTRSIGPRTRSTAAVSQGLKAMDEVSGTLIAYSTKPNYVSLDGTGRNSPYAEALAAEIRRGGTVYEVFNRVRARVEDATGEFGQSPRETNGLRGAGNFCFSACATQTGAPTAELPAQAEFTHGQTMRDCAECPEVVFIEGGEGVVGRPGHERTVTIGAFAVGKYEVTFDQWDACVADGGCSHRPSDEGWGRLSRPVINVSWNDAQEYVAWLSRKTEHTYRLLTDDEWQYAARARTTSPYSWGVDPNGACFFANGNDLAAQRAGRAATSETGPLQCDDGYVYTAPVGVFRPNGFGLYDMHGNVNEWTQDCYNSAPPCDTRRTRSSSFFSEADELRFHRGPGVGAASRMNFVGLRVARDV